MAQAAGPPKPTLWGTTPASPAISLTPLVQGSSDGITISSFPGISRRSAAVTFSNPANTIRLFSDAGCTEQIGIGSAGQLDFNGIEATVKAEATTAIYANQTEGVQVSECSSAPILYTQTNNPPQPPGEESPGGGGSGGGDSGGSGSNPSGGSPPPSVGGGQEATPVAHPGAPKLRLDPNGPANDNAPVLSGSAPGAAAVKVFATPDCSGPVDVKGPPGELASGFDLQVGDNTTSSFSAVSVGSGGAPSACSSPVVYVEDSTAPLTRITLGPAAKTRNRSPVFRFTDSAGEVTGTQFFCKVDRQKWKPCRTPLKLRKLKLRGHLLRVKATDAAGNVETAGAKRRFKVIPHP
jgi:hypothetical protein